MSRRRHAVSRCVALSLMVLSASPFTMPFATFDLAERHSSERSTPAQQVGQHAVYDQTVAKVKSSTVLLTECGGSDVALALDPRAYVPKVSTCPTPVRHGLNDILRL